MMSGEPESRIIELIIKEIGFTNAKISDETTLVGDLGIDGDDGWDLMEAFSREFNVDMTDFDENYFNVEGGCFPPITLYYYLKALALGDVHKATGITPITIGDLVAAAKSGRWKKSTRDS